MKLDEKIKAQELRQKGYSLSEISKLLGVAKSSVSLWVRDITLSEPLLKELNDRSHTSLAIEKRRSSRLANEQKKREIIIATAQRSIKKMSKKELLLIGTMLYWAEGGKTQRMVRFSNGDPNMVLIMMAFFRQVCKVPESKFRGYIHIHSSLDYKQAELYWSNITNIPVEQYFKTYRKPNKSSQNKRNSLPYGVLDVYVLDTVLFHTIVGWAKGIFSNY